MESKQTNKLLLMVVAALTLFFVHTSFKTSATLAANGFTRVQYVKHIPPTGFKLFEGFESGQLDHIWRLKGRIQLFKNNQTDAVIIQNDIVRSGKYAAKVQVKRGYERQEGYVNEKTGKIIFSERTELDAGELPLLNEDLWYGFSIYLPQDFPEINNRLSISQWKQSEQSNCVNQSPSPTISMRYEMGKLRIAIRLDDADGKTKEVYRKFIPKLEKGRWYDFVFQIKFSKNGYTTAWMDGRRVFKYKGRTLLACGDNSFYHKIGLYRDEWPQDMAIYIDNYTRGSSFDEVNPARFDKNN